jgi:signal transduction histidine kinase
LPSRFATVGLATAKRCCAAAGASPSGASGGGAGIGLLLAFSAMERGGGRIELDNPPDGGARARIALPRAITEETQGP